MVHRDDLKSDEYYLHTESKNVFTGAIWRIFIDASSRINNKMCVFGDHLVPVTQSNHEFQITKSINGGYWKHIED
jgi:hypothetical protein